MGNDKGVEVLQSCENQPGHRSPHWQPARAAISTGTNPREKPRCDVPFWPTYGGTMALIVTMQCHSSCHPVAGTEKIQTVWAGMTDERVPGFTFCPCIHGNSGAHEFVDFEGGRVTADIAFLLVDCHCRIVGDKLSPLRGIQTCGPAGEPKGVSRIRALGSIIACVVRNSQQ